MTYGLGDFSCNWSSFTYYYILVNNSSFKSFNENINDEIEFIIYELTLENTSKSLTCL